MYVHCKRVQLNIEYMTDDLYTGSSTVSIKLYNNIKNKNNTAKKHSNDPIYKIYFGFCNCCPNFLHSLVLFYVWHFTRGVCCTNTFQFIILNGGRRVIRFSFFISFYIIFIRPFDSSCSALCSLQENRGLGNVQIIYLFIFIYLVNFVVRCKTKVQHNIKKHSKLIWLIQLLSLVRPNSSRFIISSKRDFCFFVK